jgi:hypothetical protein
MNPVAGGYFSEKSPLKREVYEGKTPPTGLIAATNNIEVHFSLCY